MKKMNDEKMRQLFGLLLDLGSDTLDSGTNICRLKVHTGFRVIKFRIEFELPEEEEDYE